MPTPNSLTMQGYFHHDELLIFKKAEGKTIASVIYHYWQNKANPSEVFEFVDKVELRFSDQSGFIISTRTDAENAICVLREFDEEKERYLLMKDFGGKLDLRSSEMNQDENWRPIIGRVLIQVQLVDDGENTYRNDAVLLDFGGEKLEIRPNTEGLLIEPFEEV